jgi:hypothetical protein
MPINTTTEQDREIKAAQSSDHVSNLVAIIEDLDAQLAAWKDAADCSEPSELKSKLERMDKTLDSLSG